MNRMEEYTSLLRELDAAPPALEYTVQRAKARSRRSRVGKGFGIPLGSLGAVFAAFVLLVNLSTPFALACSSLPFLKELTAAVAFSPSLKSAVEHDYVQYVGQTRSANGVSMTVEYLIVDQKQLNLYYTTQGDAPLYEVMPEILGADGSSLPVAIQWAHPNSDGGLNCITVDFTGKQNMPDALRLVAGLYPLDAPYGEAHVPSAELGPEDAPPVDEPTERGEPAATLTFDLSFDPAYTTQGETVAVGEWISLDGQRIYVESVEIYPTHIRLQLQDDPDNTAWLKGLDFYLEDERGNRYEKIANGISATGDPDGTPFFPSHRLESSYFGDAEHLTVHITAATWLDKGGEYATIGLRDGGTARGLPENVRLAGVKENSRGYQVFFMVNQDHPLGNSLFHASAWVDPEGSEHGIASGAFGSGGAEQPRTEFGYEFPAGWSYTYFTITDCPWDSIELALSYTRYTALDAPVEVAVK